MYRQKKSFLFLAVHNTPFLNEASWTAYLRYVNNVRLDKHSIEDTFLLNLDLECDHKGNGVLL